MSNQSSDTEYAPLEMSTISDPYTVYDKMLVDIPIHWHEQMKCWVIVRYADCREVLRNNKIFARDWRRAGVEVSPQKISIQSQDPPDQTKFRNFLSTTLRSLDVDGIAAREAALVRVRLEDRRGSGVFDLQHDISAPYALALTAALLGIRKPDLQEFAKISEAIARRMDAGLDPETAGPGDRARDELYQLVNDWFTQDLEPGLITAIKAEFGMSDSIDLLVRNTVGITFNAGYSTTYATVGNATLTLLAHPQAMESLRADEELLPTAIEELVRYDGPAQGTSRIALTDVELSGVQIKRGDVVLALFAAANRDPREFDRPDELILDRQPNRHLGFGWGPHACLGAVVGQAALREYIKCLLALTPSLELAGKPVRRRTATLRCLEMMPVQVVHSR